ncbi:uncharacterized protein LOC131665387 isoform X2 [Phymastichus coffea]|uniref:uncharacterized protein LOC131665387 isoform X2 n=1 Tax=Phymastichus coffea TaxID=108790 RepID=UPI00273B47FC|nr:uncharacterized protein LOC131665387 isoform X2 [Phymastichus coffea]XP_058793238.1 uncharacterized protein LOC131665387 isoform X2 [Phymastichus coffea]
MYILANNYKGSLCKIFKRVTNNINKLKMTCIGEELYHPIETFVFFDLETTGLIKGTKMPKITELSMVATSRNSIRCDKRNKLALPRIMHKLTIPICPMQTIDPQASFASNLWNNLLDQMRPFDEATYDIIIQFINRLPGIICFVAHNGNHFDYPIFLSELDGIKKTFPDRILCVDTLPAFHEFFSDTPVSSPSLVQSFPQGYDEVDEEELVELKSHVSDSSLDDQWNNALCAIVDDFDKVQANENSKDVMDYTISDKNGQTTSTSSDSITPKNSPNKSLQAINEKTPENQIIKTTRTRISSNPRKISQAFSVKKQIEFDNSKPKNFKLSTVYFHMIGCEAENLHCAEADCITMLRCVCQIGPSFADWADMNAISLNHLKKK